MADVRSLHDNAVRVRPKTITLKPSSILVAVLRPDKQPTGANSEQDFLWIKCLGKTTAEIIRGEYEKKNLSSERLVLKHECKVLASLQISMSELKPPHDQTIAFEAVHASDTSRLVAREALQPINKQITSPAPKQALNMKDVGIVQASPSHERSLLNDGHGQDENGFRYSPSMSRVSRKQYAHAVPPMSSTGSVSRSQASSPSSRFAASQTPNLPGYGTPTQRSQHRDKTESEIGASSIKPEPGTGTDRLTTPVSTHNNMVGSSEDAKDAQDPPKSTTEQDEQKAKTFQLQNLFKDADPKMLESSVKEGVALLNRIKAPLLRVTENNPDAEQWIEQIDKLRKQAVKTKTIIGVVGNTGAGKSSVINAMLDEERLVPTNCMRACTAVVTEISYNDADGPYRAQIEFISSAEWEKELKTLFQDLLDGNGQVSRDCANEDTDAGIAYAKIKAVYPRKTKEDIVNSSIPALLRELSSVLGKTRDVKETDSLLFYKKLQQFVDSKEKTTGNKDKDKKGRRETEFWPLIRVVRIYVKSRALATGAVIVDLPGVHDANAARAAVAEGYMKQCTGLWIVAPINRAVDDKAAKSLLGESFKRQLKMDGGFNSVTFICSKTDDISLEEAQDSLGLDSEMAPSWEEMDTLVKKQKSLKKRLEEVKDTKAVYADVINDIDEQIEIYDALKEKLDDGKTVFAPKPKASKKRKTKGPGRPRKKLRRSRSSETQESDDSDIMDKDSDDSGRDSGEEEPNEADPLTAEQITAKVHDLRSQKKSARNEKVDITEKITAARTELKEAKDAEDEIHGKMSALCISGRNQYSKGAIQQDFAAGIKELDQEIAAEEDEENFNPDAEARDYDEVAASLDVFCVSSRGYQKLQGRLRKDNNISAFKTIEETEIPQLQAHCEKLTESGRSANCKSFINKLSQLLNSLTLWASSDGTGEHLTAEQRAREAKYLQKGLETLESELETAVKNTCAELIDELADNIFDKYETAVSNATKDAIDIAYKWGLPVNREDRAAGGLHWSTYKAICRRNGIYSNAQGPHEWNVQLAEPMMKILASGWEKTFARRLPMVMVTFSRNAAAPLRKFHRDVESRAHKIGSIAGLPMLQHQLSTYENILKDLSTTAKDTINSSQKDINREFVPVIERAMIDAYEQCVDERGPGSFARMKARMHSHVSNERFTMFQASADNVKGRLDGMIKDVRELMSDKTDEVFTQMRRDYRSTIGGGDIPRDGQIMPKEQRLVRKEIMKVIKGVERSFMKVAGQEVEGEEDQDDDSDKGGRLDEDVLKAEETISSHLGGNDTNIGLVKKESVLDQDEELAPSPNIQYGDTVSADKPTAEAIPEHGNEADSESQEFHADALSDSSTDADAAAESESQSDGS